MLRSDGKGGVVQASPEKAGFETTRNNTNEASMLLKTKEGMRKTNQNELKLSRD